jgi:hypothetical protein
MSFKGILCKYRRRSDPVDKNHFLVLFNRFEFRVNPLKLFPTLFRSFVEIFNSEN